MAVPRCLALLTTLCIIAAASASLGATGEHCACGPQAAPTRVRELAWRGQAKLVSIEGN